MNYYSNDFKYAQAPVVENKRAPGSDQLQFAYYRKKRVEQAKGSKNNQDNKQETSSLQNLIGLKNQMESMLMRNSQPGRESSLINSNSRVSYLTSSNCVKSSTQRSGFASNIHSLDMRSSIVSKGSLVSRKSNVGYKNQSKSMTNQSQSQCSGNTNNEQNQSSSHVYNKTRNQQKNTKMQAKYNSIQSDELSHLQMLIQQARKQSPTSNKNSLPSQCMSSNIRSSIDNTLYSGGKNLSSNGDSINQIYKQRFQGSGHQNTQSEIVTSQNSNGTGERQSSRLYQNERLINHSKKHQTTVRADQLIPNASQTKTGSPRDQQLSNFSPDMRFENTDRTSKSLKDRQNSDESKQTKANTVVTSGYSNATNRNRRAGDLYLNLPVNQQEDYAGNRQQSPSSSQRTLEMYKKMQGQQQPHDTYVQQKIEKMLPVLNLDSGLGPIPERAREDSKKEIKRRVNPYEDPNFDPEGSEFDNSQRKNSLYTQNQMNLYYQNEEDYQESKLTKLSQNYGEDSVESPTHSSQYMYEDDQIESPYKNNRDDVEYDNFSPVLVAKCKLKRQRFETNAPRASQIGGGKSFRESQIQRNITANCDAIKSFASRIPANSLSDIQSIESQDEEEDSDAHNQQNTTKLKSPDEIKPKVAPKINIIRPTVELQQEGLQNLQQDCGESSSSSDDNIIKKQIIGDSDQEDSTQKVPQSNFGNAKGLNYKNSVLYHKNKYQDYMKYQNKQNAQGQNVEEILQVRKYLQSNRIKAIKYNYSLDPDGQSYTSFQSYIQLVSGDDGKHEDDQLLLINRKPKEDLKYTTNQDPKEISKMRLQAFKESHKRVNMNESHQSIQDSHEDIVVNTEVDEDDEDFQFNDKTSSASCSVKDIEAIMIGGTSSRFWILRKHINSLDLENLKKIPFHSWNCLTLQLAHREVDLVIRNEDQMNKLLKFLIYSLRTLDGSRNSASNVLNLMNKECIQDYKKLHNREVVKKERIVETNEYKIFSKVYLKYKVMIIRQKISYMALEKCMTVVELIVDSIQRTYKQLMKSGEIKVCKHKQYHMEKISQQLSKGSPGVFIRIIQMNMANADQENPTYQQSQQKLLIMSSLKKTQAKVKTTVKKFGKIKEVKIDEQKNTQQQNEIKEILKKDQCMDIFKDAVIDRENELFDFKTHEQFIQYKFQKKSKLIIYNKLRLMMNMKLIGGLIYVQAILKRIQIAKDLMIIELEQGNEVLISKELSQDDLPLSFRYYDSILRIIQRKINPHQREMQIARKSMANMFHENNAIKILRDQLFGTDKKASVQNHIINKKERKEINILESSHTMDIQRSRYVAIDDNILDRKKCRPNKSKVDILKIGQLSNTGYQEKYFNHDILQTNLNIKYLNPSEVTTKRQKFLNYKKTFSAKVSFLKQMGENIMLTKKLDFYITDLVNNQLSNKEIDQLIDKFQRQNASDRPKSAPPSRKQMHRNNNEKKYLIELMQKQTEKILNKRILRRRSHQVDTLKKVSKLNQIYEKKLQFVEELIERDIKYFTFRTQTTIEKEVECLQKVVQMTRQIEMLKRMETQQCSEHNRSQNGDSCQIKLLQSQSLRKEKLQDQLKNLTLSARIQKGIQKSIQMHKSTNDFSNLNLLQLPKVQEKLSSNNLQSPPSFDMEMNLIQQESYKNLSDQGNNDKTRDYKLLNERSNHRIIDSAQMTASNIKVTD